MPEDVCVLDSTSSAPLLCSSEVVWSELSLVGCLCAEPPSAASGGAMAGGVGGTICSALWFSDTCHTRALAACFPLKQACRERLSLARALERRWAKVAHFRGGRTPTTHAAGCKAWPECQRYEWPPGLKSCPPALSLVSAPSVAYSAPRSRRAQLQALRLIRSCLQRRDCVLAPQANTGEGRPRRGILFVLETSLAGTQGRVTVL